MNFNFPYKEKSGISQLMSNGSRECLQVIELLCTYDPEERSVFTYFRLIYLIACSLKLLYFYPGITLFSHSLLLENIKFY